MLACMGGLMMIGFAKPIAVAKGLASTATVGVLALSIVLTLETSYIRAGEPF
jgi:OFA family oxalate/formate antiporter-like MFS transporter